MRPARYKHDCDRCVYVGRSGPADCYAHPASAGGEVTIVCRYSDEPSDYRSGLPFVGRLSRLSEAGLLAVVRGVLPLDSDCDHGRKLGDRLADYLEARDIQNNPGA